MTYIKENWNGKNERGKQAKEHTFCMENLYKNEILHSINGTKVYDEYFRLKKEYDIYSNMEIAVKPYDTVFAGKVYHMDGKIALLNFASYKEPGGMFLAGSKAQEECLCHSSFLYNVLLHFTEYYERNNKQKNKALYLNRALYSPDVIFEHDGTVFSCDVISCAAPNKSVAKEYCGVSDKENSIALKLRIGYVLDVAADNNVEVLILGGYGCGVFGQNPTEVATIFKEYLETTHQCFKKVIFAIPEGRDGNLKVFENVFARNWWDA